MLLFLILLWLIIWNILLEKDIKKMKKHYNKKIYVLNKKLKNIEQNQNYIFDYIDNIYYDLESRDNYEKK